MSSLLNTGSFLRQHAYGRAHHPHIDGASALGKMMKKRDALSWGGGVAADLASDRTGLKIITRDRDLVPGFADKCYEAAIPLDAVVTTGAAGAAEMHSKTNTGPARRRAERRNNIGSAYDSDKRAE
jgi:hypothetical protein